MANSSAARKLRLATVWLGGCSGCNMSFLDLGEHLLELAERAELVYGPFTDIKEFPAGVDITVVEGSINTTENLELFRKIRAHTKVVVSYGDCAVTGNVSSLRNVFTTEEVLAQSYGQTAEGRPYGNAASRVLPQLLPKSYPLHHILPVDAFIPGCPPDPERTWPALLALLRGEKVELAPQDRSFG
jgi:NAD-reducing hydrogenase small subunit